MAAGVSARLTKAQGRRFGLTVGIAFLVLAGIVWWRDHHGVATGLASLGLALGFGGLFVPTHLGPIERAWMRLAHLLSKVTTPIVMAVMYFVVITPTAYLRRMFGGNPLSHQSGVSGFWHTRPPNARRSASMERQF